MYCGFAGIGEDAANFAPKGLPRQESRQPLHDVYKQNLAWANPLYFAREAST
jgi:hypothetical protein